MEFIMGVYKIWRVQSGFTEIVTQMEEDSFFTEKQSIRDSARSLKKYGSTCNHVRNTDVLIRHEVEKTDTLQGIALKYGCTTEQIRRANRLFASDSLFLRQYLMIPVDRNSPYAPKDERPNSLPLQRGANSLAGSADTNANNSRSLDHMPLSPDEENRRSVDEFLGKIDSTIAESRKYVKKSQNSIDFLSPDCVDGDGLFSSSTSRRTNSSGSYGGHASSSTSYQHHHRNSSSGSDSSHLIAMTQGRHVQNSLQRLERQQDELFEL